MRQHNANVTITELYTFTFLDQSIQYGTKGRQEVFRITVCIKCPTVSCSVEFALGEIHLRVLGHELLQHVLLLLLLAGGQAHLLHKSKVLSDW